MYLNICVCDEFRATRNSTKVKFWTFQAQPASGLFHPYFVCESSFTVSSMIKMVILDQIKPISLYLKIKKLEIQKSEICKLYVYYL